MLTAAAYALGSLPTQVLIREVGLSAAFFIPAGLTVAFLLRLPTRYWWVVLAAAGVTETLMDLAVGYEPALIAFFVAANVLEPLLGASIVRRQCGAVDIARLRHFGWFVLGPVTLATALAAAIGSFGFALVEGANLGLTFLQWWVGDGLGVVLIAGAILAYGSSPDRRSLASPWGAVLLLGSALLMVLVVRTGLPLSFLLLIGLLPAGAFFGPRGVAMTGLAMAIGQVGETAFGSRLLLVGVPEATALMVVKLRLGIYVLAGFTVSAEANEVRLAAARTADVTAQSLARDVQARIERDVATRLQLALLPRRMAPLSQVEVAYRYEPGSDGLLVGGDWCEVFPLAEGRVGISVGDVAGHGLEAAATMGNLRTALSVLAQHTTSPGELLGFLDDHAREVLGADFTTATYAAFDPENGRLTYASAGHPPMLVISPEGRHRWLDDGRSSPLHAGMPGKRPEAATELTPGSLLVAYSDGLIERRGEDLRVGLERLARAATRLAGRPPEEVCERLLHELGSDDVSRDDVVLVVLRYSPTHSGKLPSA